MSVSHAAKPVIFIVEDAPETLDLLAEDLHDAGFETRIAQSGESALRQMDFARPDLILLDVRLPGIDGFETCRRLKEMDISKDIPVIFITALSDTVDKVKGFDLGGVDYLTKPIQAEEVIARVKTHLTIRTLQQELRTQNLLLEEQKTRFQTLAEATFEGIIFHEEGNILEVNQTLEQMFAYPRVELIGRNLLEFIPPTAHELVQDHIAAGTEDPYETEAIRKNGDIFPIEIQTKMIPHQDQRLRIAAIRDLSRHKAIEAEKARLEKENQTLRTTNKDRYNLGDIIGKSPAMQEIYELAAHTAASDANVMITGESGAGKGLIARTIHHLSDRQDHAFVSVNCGAVPDSLFESEFFGYRKGAFTGADRDKSGYFDQAHQGTLFLDEVGELSPLLQVKLLQAIEEGQYMPVGSTVHKTVDVRTIAATNRNIEEQMHTGAMREDFFFRLSVITIHAPPLRERKEDLPLLIEHVLEQYRTHDSRPVLPARVFQALLHHDWPGNIRELQNVLQRYLTLKRLEFPGSRGAISANNHEGCPVLETEVESKNLQEAVEAFEKQLLLRTLEQHHWHKIQTAQALDIGRNTLYRKMKQFDLL